METKTEYSIDFTAGVADDKQLSAKMAFSAFQQMDTETLGIPFLTQMLHGMGLDVIWERTPGKILAVCYDMNVSRRIKVQYLDDEVPLLMSIDKGNWIDLCAAERVELNAGEFKLVHLGVAMRLPNGFEAHLAPRSSTFKKWGIIQTNSVGVIDNSYSGPNDWWRFPAYATRDTVIERGDRICQFRIMEIQPSVVFETCTLDGQDRGGFGSTGTKEFIK